MPDSNRHIISAGIGYTRERYELNLVYQYSLSVNRDVTGSYPGTALAGVTDGHWESQAHSVMGSLTMKF